MIRAGGHGEQEERKSMEKSDGPHLVIIMGV
jgi:hypothetical protein